MGGKSLSKMNAYNIRKSKFGITFQYPGAPDSFVSLKDHRQVQLLEISANLRVLEFSLFLLFSSVVCHPVERVPGCVPACSHGKVTSMILYNIMNCLGHGRKEVLT